MLSTLRFCRAIKYRSVWHVSAMRRRTSQFRTLAISVGGRLAWPISAEMKAVDRHLGQTKMADSSIRMSSSFVCLKWDVLSGPLWDALSGEMVTPEML